MAKKINSRIVAAQILLKLIKQKGSLASELAMAEGLPDSDRRLVHELSYGVCRWYFFLESIAEKFLSKPLKQKDNDIYLLILIGVYQLTFTRIPSHAAINETVNAVIFFRKLWAKKLINAVLRSFQRELESQAFDITIDAYKASHPAWLQQKITQYWPQQADSIFQENNTRPPMTLRVNTQKVSLEDYQITLNNINEPAITAEKTPYSATGLQLDAPVNVQLLPDFDKGYASVQDEAAQLAAELLQVEPDHRVLDACCAPGGKTGHIMELCPQIKELVALDLEERRLERVRENLLRLNINATVVCGDGTKPENWWDGERFDRILLDAPCSATGVIRRHPDIKLLRSQEAIDELAGLQLSLLQSLWPLLVEGGILLYATCSILPEENVQLIERFMTSQNDCQHDIIDASWGLPQAYGRQLLPQHNGHDGFYYARLKKQSSLE